MNAAHSAVQAADGRPERAVPAVRSGDMSAPGLGSAAGKGTALPGRAGVHDSLRLGSRQFGRGKWQV